MGSTGTLKQTSDVWPRSRVGSGNVTTAGGVLLDSSTEFLLKVDQGEKLQMSG